MPQPSAPRLQYYQKHLHTTPSLPPPGRPGRSTAAPIKQYWPPQTTVGCMHCSAVLPCYSVSVQCTIVLKHWGPTVPVVTLFQCFLPVLPVNRTALKSLVYCVQCSIVLTSNLFTTSVSMEVWYLRAKIYIKHNMSDMSFFLHSLIV